MRKYYFFIFLTLNLVYGTPGNYTLLSSSRDTTLNILNTSVSTYHTGLKLTIQDKSCGTTGLNVNDGFNDSELALAPSPCGIGIATYGGILGVALDSGSAAVEGFAYGDSGASIFGVIGQAEHGTYDYGVYGSADSAKGSDSVDWAGYFNGNINVTGSIYNTSDGLLKTNIRPINDGLSKILALNPKSYIMKVDEYQNRINLPNGERYGLIAKDVENVLPELVHNVRVPSQTPKVGTKRHMNITPLDLKSVDYVSLIPILIEAVKEQQAEIDSLKNSR